MENNGYRAKIDEIDAKMTELFTERMNVAGEIAAFKKEKGLPVLDPKREREKIESVREAVPEAYQDYVEQLYRLMFELSRSHQHRLIGRESDLVSKILRAVEETPNLFPERASVACQGTEGAFSGLAADRLFRHPGVMYFSTFGAVFTAIEKGLCRYGVVPLENSTAGSVNSVYDLMMEHHFYIVRSIRLKVDHNLLAKPGVKLSEIREIRSHEQALAQSAGFLQSLPNVKVVAMENTAVAAESVARSERRDVAAIASSEAMRSYGLECLKESVQDKRNNYTRFICISKDLEIYPGADRTSLMAVLPHEAVSLYKMLSRFYALGINLNKLESRPLPDRDFEFMFYFDLDTPVYSPRLLELLGGLGGVTERFSYLGSYSEVI